MQIHGKAEKKGMQYQNGKLKNNRKWKYMGSKNIWNEGKIREMKIGKWKYMGRAKTREWNTKMGNEKKMGNVKKR